MRRASEIRPTSSPAIRPQSPNSESKNKRVSIEDPPPPFTPAPPTGAPRKLRRKKRNVDVEDLIDKYRHWQQADDAEAEEENVKKPFVEYTWFNSLVGVVITANAVTIGLEANARSANRSRGRQEEKVWYQLEIMFCILFTVELGLRLYFHGPDYFTILRPIDFLYGSVKSRIRLCFRIPFLVKYENLVDLFIVLSSILDSFVLAPLGTKGDVRAVSLLRFMRLLRLARLVRLLKIFRELWLVASGLFNALMTLVWVCVIIFILCYVCAIGLTIWVGQNDDVYDDYFRDSGWDHEVYFATVPMSVFTLVQIITFDNWVDGIVRHVMKNQPALRWLFLFLTCVVSMGLLNIIIGVVVENIVNTAKKDEKRQAKAKEENRKRIFGQMQDIFERADEDESGSLDIGEVRKALEQPEVYSKLRLIDFPVDKPEEIFHALDYDDTGELQINEFIDGCLRISGKAQSKDLLVAQVALDCMRRSFNEFEMGMALANHKLARLQSTAKAIIDNGECVLLDMQKYRLRHPEVKETNLLNEMHNKESMAAPWEKGFTASDSDTDEGNDGPKNRGMVRHQSFLSGSESLPGSVYSFTSGASSLAKGRVGNCSDASALSRRAPDRTGICATSVACLCAAVEAFVCPLQGRGTPQSNTAIQGILGQTPAIGPPWRRPSKVRARPPLFRPA